MRQNLPDDTLRQRLPIVIAGLLLVSVLLMLRLVSFQFQLDPAVTGYLESVRASGYQRTLRQAAVRGNIYDRDLQAMAVNSLEYRVGISPNLISQPRETAIRLAGIMGLDELDTFNRITSEVPWVLLSAGVSADQGRQVAELDLLGVTIEARPRRYYPQGSMAAQVVGFVGGDLQGYYGVEGFYDVQLAGREQEQMLSNIPFDVPEDHDEDRGSDIVLTIDREIQYLAESELESSVALTNAARGNILVMDPRSGEMLAMASWPTFDPNAWYEVRDDTLLQNAAINGLFEPGSLMQVLTLAVALERGAYRMEDTYLDRGYIEAGGVQVQNWDRKAHGVVDLTTVLVETLNVGAATISMQMGPAAFYSGLREFGIGEPTGIDLQGELPGILFVPGDEDYNDSLLLTNSFGQGVAVTPLQILTAFSAIANDGLMMQPHVFRRLLDGDEVRASSPSTLGRPISAATARQVTEMMVTATREGMGGRAGLPGYTVAGTAGTAQVPTTLGYEAGTSIVSFIGFLPADDPRVIVFIRLDHPNEYWGAAAAAPVFQRLAQRLVIMMNIPPDDVRRDLVAAGGAVEAIQH
ncbi:MAG: penicillin-binding protein 2 [Anaerolineaceae bacterium]|nr:penicillin-binding protein 2 [Anaerolineaceae bacterium]MDE0329120.1 penicillin-binding protein 2 [Anaerolineaceae bacterium]